MAGSRDEFRIREAIRNVEGSGRKIANIAPSTMLPLPKLGRASTSVQAHHLGTFALLRNTPNALVVGSNEIPAYAACAVAEGDDVLLHRCSGEDSGGYWIAVPCTSAGTGTNNQVECDLFEDNEAPLQWTIDFAGITTYPGTRPQPIGGLLASYAHMSLADRQDTIAGLNTSHTLTRALPCIWEKQASILVTSGDTISYGILMYASGVVDTIDFPGLPPRTETEIVVAVGSAFTRAGSNHTILSVNQSKALIPSRGWTTTKAGKPYLTRLQLRDYFSISDFQYLNPPDAFFNVVYSLNFDNAQFVLSPV